MNKEYLFLLLIRKYGRGTPEEEGKVREQDERDQD
jgi:hypothetical protein